MSNKKYAQQVIEFPMQQMQGPQAIELAEKPQCHHDHDEKEGEEEEIIFVIGLVPGAPDEVILGEPDEDEEVQEVSLEEEQQEEIDEWHWEKSHGVGKFLHWLKSMIDNTPPHDGKSIGGLKRASSYFDRLKKEIDKAMSQDFKREIDAAKAEEARDMIIEELDKLSKRLQKIISKKEKKAGNERGDLIKEAETSMVGNIQVVVPYLISFIARVCIEASVQGGKDMKDTFEKLGKEYKLDKREQVQVIQLIKDMNYPLNLNRIRILDGILDINDGEGEWIKGYQA